LYESLLLRAHITENYKGEQTEMNQSPLKAKSDPLSLHVKAIRQQMNIFTASKSSACYQWCPRFSSLAIRNYDCAMSLISIAILNANVDNMPVFFFLSQLIDGNPGNAKLLANDMFFNSMIDFVEVAGDKARIGIFHILLQLLRYEISPLILDMLLEVAKKVKKTESDITSDQSVSSFISEIRQSAINSDRKVDDTASQVLCILGTIKMNHTML
jgi:hypothetical protein